MINNIKFSSVHFYFCKQALAVGYCALPNQMRKTIPIPLKQILNQKLLQIQKLIKKEMWLNTVRSKLKMREWKMMMYLVLLIIKEDWSANINNIHLNLGLSRDDCPVMLYHDALTIVNSYPGLTQYFTDGSKRDEKVGAGIVSDSLTRGFRLPDHYSVYDAELFGVFAAIENILQEDEPAVIFSDFLSSLIAINNGISTHPLVIKICNLLIVSPILIKLSYIPAHIGIQGNECTDSWARSS